MTNDGVVVYFSRLFDLSVLGGLLCKRGVGGEGWLGSSDQVISTAVSED